VRLQDRLVEATQGVLASRRAGIGHEYQWGRLQSIRRWFHRFNETTNVAGAVVPYENGMGMVAVTPALSAPQTVSLARAKAKASAMATSFHNRERRVESELEDSLMI
jgi:hypothetical protein